MKAPQKRNVMIDAMRFLICPLIVFIHCPFPGVLGQGIVNIGRLGVPFFLLLSGWFSHQADRAAMLAHARKKLRDTAKLLICFAVLYTLMNSVSSLLTGDSPLAWLGLYRSIYHLVYLILFNRAVFFGSTAYYAFMLMYVYVIFLFLVKTRLLEKAFYAIGPLLTVTVALGAFTDLSWYYYGNFLFTGLPFFLLGHWLRANHGKLPQSPFLWGGLLAAGVISTLLEARFFRDAYCFLGTVLMAVSLLMLSVSSPLSFGQPALLACLRRYSVYIFVIHCGIRDILDALMKRCDLSCPESVFPLLVLFVSLSVGIVWDLLIAWFKRKRRVQHDCQSP